MDRDMSQEGILEGSMDLGHQVAVSAWLVSTKRVAWQMSVGERSDGWPPLDLWTLGQLAEQILLIWLLLTPVLECIMEMGSFWLQGLRVASESAEGMVVAEVEEYSSSTDVASPQ